MKRNPRKVIVLDCDNTLWKGVCGEDGPLGIEVSEPHRTLQAFMVDRMRAGMLLCLCSKNNEADVLDVFDQRPDMVLKREHLVARRINWTASRTTSSRSRTSSTSGWTASSLSMTTRWSAPMFASTAPAS